MTESDVRTEGEQRAVARTATRRELEQQRTRHDRPILIKDAVVISMDSDVGDLSSGDILIDHGAIKQIAADIPGDAAAGAVLVDASGLIAIPGIVDTHRHMWHTQLRQLLPDTTTFEDYAQRLLFQITSAFTAEDMYVGNLLGAIGAIDAGVTNVLDFSHNSRSPAFRDAALAGLVDSGIRAVQASAAPIGGEWDEAWPADVVRLRDSLPASAADRVSVRLGAMIWDVNAESLGFARDNGFAVNVDGVFGSDAARSVDQLLDAGLLGPDITLTHCNGFAPSTWDRLADVGVHVSLTPATDTQFGLGEAFVPVNAALRAGIVPTIGVDTEAILFSDMFTAMRLVLAIQRLVEANRGWHGSEPSAGISSRDVLAMSTIQGARANGVVGQVGSLTPGKRADLVLMSTQALNCTPLNNAIGTVVHAGSPGNVDSVFIDGIAHKFAGSLIGVDVAALRERAIESRDSVLAKSGYSLSITD